MHVPIALGIFLALFIAAGNAITCYECDSLHDRRCNEFFCPQGITETNCDEAEMPEYLKKNDRVLKATGCMTKIHESVNDDRFFIRRSCYFGDPENTEEACNVDDEYVPYADLLSCNVCIDDLCNTDAGRQVKSSEITLATAIAVGFGLYNKFLKI